MSCGRWVTFSTDLITVAKSTKNWGYCSYLCESEMDRARVLQVKELHVLTPKKQNRTQESHFPTQETRLTILSDSQCRILNSTNLVYRSDIEFCAGQKLDFPHTTVYRRYRVKGKDRTYIFKKNTTLVNPVRRFVSLWMLGINYIYSFCLHKLDAKEEHMKLGFYLGQTDSCQGDSGGPIYIFIGNKIILHFPSHKRRKACESRTWTRLTRFTSQLPLKEENQ